ncbi:synaptic vesicle glycoprotein 2A-like isoform X2 [Cylas formicarius]|uniref:synaptic vesicle glycoprotein 2A-like isoform X2 n=1 Tax=Cylas formicarius TaxID=197179 RepID=UPI00295853A8|nr:synaptic vesicle glycoprotein 2A-like isoform X2 [Cylas formicarius]
MTFVSVVLVVVLSTLSTSDKLIMGDSTEIYFEHFLEESGWGLYSKFIIGLTCFCNFAQGFTLVALPMALALSSCQSSGITDKIVLRIFTSFYIGRSFGGLCTNCLADRYGRKRYLTYSLMVVFLSTFTSAFAYNPYVNIGSAFFLGMGIENNTTVLRLLLIESLPLKKRGSYFTFCTAFWSLGYLTTIGGTLTFKPPPLLSSLKGRIDSKLAPWRIMFAVCGGLNLFIACACALLEESPRYFLSLGKNYLAYLVLKQLYAINNSKFADTFKTKEDDIKNVIRPYEFAYVEPEQYWDVFQVLCWRFYRAVRMAFSRRLLTTTLALIAIKTPIMVVGVFQLHVALSKQLAPAGEPDHQLKGLDFSYPVVYPGLYYPDLGTNGSLCADTKANGHFLTYVTVLGLNVILGFVATAVMVDRLGRKIPISPP